MLSLFLLYSNERSEKRLNSKWNHTIFINSDITFVSEYIYIWYVYKTKKKKR